MQLLKIIQLSKNLELISFFNEFTTNLIKKTKVYL